MRLHRLEVEAFGPFADAQAVDFDALGEPGLFLLHGATGAGKTSVLDAVCFALYGQVPGARRHGRPRLRSDHAADSVAPRVVLELSIGGRRLEVTRSPEWQRPKKRGTGTTREPASTDVRELVDGEWQVLVGRRSDEAGLLLHDLLGMGLEQFTKVVMLPQGEFAAFLRAGAEERAELLSRLFDIDRYTGVETWLRDERQRLARRVADADAGRDALVARAQQAATAVIGTTDGAALGPTDELALAAPPGPELVDALAATARTALDGARATATRCRDEATAAEQTLRSAEDLTRRLDRRADLTTTIRALDAASAEHQADLTRLDAARRAQRLAVGLRQLAEADRAAALAAAEVGTAVLHARALIASATDTTPDDPASALEDALAALVDERRRELARLDGARALGDELDAVRAELDDTTAGAASAARDADDATTAAREAGRALAASQARLEALLERSGTLAAAERALADAETVHDAAGALVDCTIELRRRADARRDAREAEQAAHGRLLDLRERRLHGMAAELATRLRPDGACPVCGGHEHPRPAQPTDDHVDDAGEQQARVEHETARTALQAADAAHADVAARHAVLTAAARGLDAPAAAQALRERRAEAESAQAAAGQLAEARTAVDHDRVALAEAEQRLQHSRARHAELASAVTHLAPRCERLTSSLAEHLKGAPDLPTRAARVSAELAALERVADARSRSASCQAQQATLRQTLAGAATDLGFDDVEQAGAAVLDDQTLSALEHAVSERQRVRADAVAVLSTDELAGLDEAQRPPLEALQAAAEQSATRAREAERQLTLTDQADSELRRLAEQLREHDDVHRELRERHRNVDELSRCVDGTGGGNTRRMRLSAFVLAARLEEVAAAASERLLAMSDGRYALAHTDGLAKGGARSGLGLQVVDGWTGVARETATLSGGESFLASLALALGLADVVHAEAGGTAIETLFVDEGFGSLDDDTLEEVMGVLDGLRDGGRAVGVVSHVADLRSRITSQLEIVKGRSGSTIRPVRATGVDVHRAAG